MESSSTCVSDVLTLSMETFRDSPRQRVAVFQIDLNVQLFDLWNVRLVLDNEVAGIANVLYKHRLPRIFIAAQQDI